MFPLNRMLWGIGVIVALGICLDIAAGNQLGYDPQMVSQVPTAAKVVALTIDDGPHGKTTPEILAVLRAKKVRATFFVLGVNAEEHPGILAQELADGHEIGTHGYSHAKLPKLSQNKIDEELNKTERAIMAVGPKPQFFRPPGGEYSEEVLTTARDREYTVVMWSVDPEDWRRPPVDAVVERVVAKTRPGSIILLHDGQYPLPTAAAIGRIIDRLRGAGYEFVTLSELLRYKKVAGSAGRPPAGEPSQGN